MKSAYAYPVPVRAAPSRFQPAPTGPRVLFVCSHNCIRSPMAEALYNLKAKRSHAQSAGIDPGVAVKPQVVMVLKEKLLDLSKFRPRKFEPPMAQGAQKVIVMGLAGQEIKGDNVVAWDVPLPASSLDEYRSLRNVLEKKIDALILEIEGARPPG